jgi:hypothetical protein
MSEIDEIPANPTLLNAALRQGLESLDLGAVTAFQVYSRTVLPVDGFVFWTPIAGATGQFNVKGSLHYAQDLQQQADETVGYATVVLSAEDKITELSEPDQDRLYVATLGEFRYAFSGQKGFYANAGIWHYIGHSVYPALASQLLDPGNTIDLSRAVVSNSLPLWLALNTYVPVYADAGIGVHIYPAYLVEENLVPPYAAVEVLKTEGIGAAPLLGVNGYGAHTQLVKDTCRITVYGLQNNEALAFQDFINSYSVDTDRFGVMSVSVMVDDKRVQTEVHAIAMKKTFDIEISYYQSTSAVIAYQLIEAATPVPITVGDLVAS